MGGEYLGGACFDFFLIFYFFNVCGGRRVKRLLMFSHQEESAHVLTQGLGALTRAR